MEGTTSELISLTLSMGLPLEPQAELLAVSPTHASPIRPSRMLVFTAGLYDSIDYYEV